MKLTTALLCVACGLPLAAQPALSQQLEKVRVATTFLGLWDTSQPTFCKNRGEFARAGLDVDVISTRGGSENVQTVVAGATDIGYSPGINSVLSAYRAGSKIKIISAEFMGQNDSFFYVRSDSPLRTIDGIKGKTVAYSRPGSATEAILRGVKAERKIEFTATPTGAMDATFTMVMTRQLDVGFASPPGGLDRIDSGEIRVLFSGDDVQSQKHLTNRVTIASANFVQSKRGVAQKFLEVLDRCIEWAYANQAESSKMYAAMNKIEPAVAVKAMAFYKREALAFGPMTGFDEVIKQAVENKFIDRPFSPEELKDLIDILYTSKK